MAFVAEIGATIRQKALVRAGVHVALVQARVAEDAHEEVGGSAYRQLRQELETAQQRYFATFRTRNVDPANASAVDCTAVRRAQEEAEAAFHLTRLRNEQTVHQAEMKAVRNYWTTRTLRGIPDTFFADCSRESPASRMQRIHPPWWGAFLAEIQKLLVYGHPAEGYLLDALPQLRRDATKKTLAALIDEWHEEHSLRWGWFQKPHYRMLAIRAAKKAGQLSRWMDENAPGFLTNDTVQRSLYARLDRSLAASDPWGSLASHRRTRSPFSEHGRN